MARKGDRLPESAEDFAGPAIQGVDEIQKLAKSARASNAKKAKAEDRKSNVPDEVYRNNWLSISEAAAECKRVEKELKQAKGVLQQRYATAQNDGCNIKAMKRLRKMEREDSDELDMEMRTVGRIAEIVESTVAQMSFFAKLDTAAPPNPYVQGFTAGKAGDDNSTNPHKPGGEANVKWSEGWKAGQVKLAEESFGKKPAKAEAGIH